jgi:hypothetical protein
VAQLGSALDWGSRGRRFKSCRPDTANKGGTRSSGAALAASTSGDVRVRCTRCALGAAHPKPSVDLQRPLSDYLTGCLAGRPRMSDYCAGRSPNMLPTPALRAAPGRRVRAHAHGSRVNQTRGRPGRVRLGREHPGHSKHRHHSPAMGRQRPSEDSGEPHRASVLSDRVAA